MSVVMRSPSERPIMADCYVQGSFAFICTAAESALIEEAWQHAADLRGDFAPGEPSAEFLIAFPPTDLANPFNGLLAIFDDPAFPDFGAELEISGPDLCQVSIHGLTDFQPAAIAELIRRCCPATLAEAPIGFDWSYSCTRPYRDSFGGGYCTVFPDRVQFGTTREALTRSLAAVAVPDDPTVYPWAENPDHPLSDWKAEVADDDTRLGYADWLAARRDTVTD
jgi:hypothetical protein